MATEQPHDWRFIDGQIRSLAKRRAKLDAEEARWLREAEAVRLWREVGEPSMLAYLEKTCGYKPKTGQERMRVARMLGTLPQIEYALSVGALSYSAVRELTRVATPATEDEWLIAAIDKNQRQIEDLVNGHEPGDLPGDPKKPELMRHSMTFEMSAATFALMRQCRRQTAEDMGATPDDDTFLTMLAKHYLNGSSDDMGPRNQIGRVTICKCGNAWQEGAGVAVPIDAADVEQAFCDAKHIGALDAPSPERAHTDITDAVRRFVWHRDQGRCRVEGCRSSRGLDIHHILPREKGGSHEPSNLILCCGGHHRAAHRGKMTITGTADKLVVERPQSAADVRGAARQGLVKMGFRAKEAESLLDKASAHVGAGASLKALLHEALRCSPS